MAKRGRPKARPDISPPLLREIKDRIRLTGSAESVYEQEPRIITKHTYTSWLLEFPDFSTEIDDALGDYRRSQPSYFRRLAESVAEEYLLSHDKPKITTTKVIKTKYKAGKKPNELVIDFSEEYETITERIYRCPTKIIEMFAPQAPSTTIEVLATQMANEGIMPQKRAEVIMAIADRAQENIREVLSGSSDAEEEL